jgi:hypothetical protein
MTHDSADIARQHTARTDQHETISDPVLVTSEECDACSPAPDSAAFLESSHPPRTPRSARRTRPSVLVASLLLAAALGCLHHPASPPASPRPVELRFIRSPYADYPFHLLYRDTTRLAAVRSLPLDSVPTLGTLIALPEIVASARVNAYREIFPFVELYRHPPGRIVTAPVPRLLSYSDELPAYHIPQPAPHHCSWRIGIPGVPHHLAARCRARGAPQHHRLARAGQFLSPHG